eukprot:TRINITY_DN32059_c0_g1_i2.p1 TRINITY_DN32059_c0_g1~~TRINITY_DN32059_c0_g1_i2.p1  ORF type:complete len:304 (-),score=70.47 TRINITY_DN32059_c0_g1_i2:266-1177(-)
MGNTMPTPDDKLLMFQEKLKLSNKDLKKLWGKFCAMDHTKTGSISLDDFFKMMRIPRSVFGDSMFELVECEITSHLDFTAFVAAVGTYCLFSEEDVLRFCFYIFDKDKNGYIEEDELNALLDMLHKHDPKSNLKVAMEKYDKNGDGRIDFKEFLEMNKRFPQLLFPAFRMKEHFARYTLGINFWRNHKSVQMKSRKKIQEKQDAPEKAEQKKKLIEMKRRQRAEMGCCVYYCCCGRNRPFKVLPEDEEENNGGPNLNAIRQHRKAREKGRAKDKRQKDKKAQRKTDHKKRKERNKQRQHRRNF